LVRAQNEARTELALFSRVNSARRPSTARLTQRNFFKQTMRLSSERAADLGFEAISKPASQRCTVGYLSPKTLPGGEAVALGLADNRRICRLPKAKAYGL
jgi:hypothetical protein